MSYVLNISTGGQQDLWVHSNSTAVVVPDLIPYSMYFISVAASTRVGTGLFSKNVIFNTPETGIKKIKNHNSNY